jgi:CRP/FNR family transcriptional regulator
MTEINDLKSVLLLTYLKDAMLKKVAEITLMKEYRAGDYIFREGDNTTRLYAIIDGKVGLEIEKDSSTRILIDTLPQGRAFGFSALVDTEEKKYTSSAKAMIDTKVFSWKAVDLETLFHQDYELGLLFMKRIAKIIKTRLQIRNIQFLDIYR